MPNQRADQWMKLYAADRREADRRLKAAHRKEWQRYYEEARARRKAEAQP